MTFVHYTIIYLHSFVIEHHYISVIFNYSLNLPRDQLPTSRLIWKLKACWETIKNNSIHDSNEHFRNLFQKNSKKFFIIRQSIFRITQQNNTSRLYFLNKHILRSWWIINRFFLVWKVDSEILINIHYYSTTGLVGWNMFLMCNSWVCL